MSTDPAFLEDLQTALLTLGEIETQLTKVKQQRDIIRDKIKAWLESQTFDEFETFDIKGDQLWRLKLSKSNRRKADLDYLERILSDKQYSEAITETEVESFKCQPVKNRKKTTSKPAAPSV
jgi:hypothetical protein